MVPGRLIMVTDGFSWSRWVFHGFFIVPGRIIKIPGFYGLPWFLVSFSWFEVGVNLSKALEGQMRRW